MVMFEKDKDSDRNSGALGCRPGEWGDCVPELAPPHHRFERFTEALAERVRAGINIHMHLDAAGSAYANLLAAGVRIDEYLPQVLHAKTVTVDGKWAMLGTANLGYRSLFVNYELNLVTQGPELSSKLKQQFLGDMDDSVRIQPARWGRCGWLARLSRQWPGWCGVGYRIGWDWSVQMKAIGRRRVLVM